MNREKRDAIAAELRRCGHLSDRAVAERAGASGPTVAKVRRGLVESGAIPDHAARLGRDGRRRGGAAKVVQLGAARPPLGGHRIDHADIRTWAVPDGSVSLLFTDPMYRRDALPQWRALGRFAARTLRPGGLLVAYAGHAWLPQQMAALAEHLTYVWTCAVVHGGHLGRACRGFRVGWKPLVVFVKGRQEPSGYPRDVFMGPGPAKGLHKYGQPPEEAAYFIDRLTRAGEVVADPFAGGFNTMGAAVAQGRVFWGCDRDAGCVIVGRERLARLVAAKGPPRR